MTAAIGLLLFFAATLLCVQSQLRTQASWTLNTARYQHEVAIASASAGAVAAVRAVEDVRADIIDAIMAAGASADDEYFLHATTFELWPDLRKKGAKVTVDPNKLNQANDFGKGFYTWRAKDPASAASAMNSGIQSAIDWAARKMPNGMQVGVIALFRVEAAVYAGLDVFGPASPLSENLIGPNGLTGHDVVFGPLSASAGPGWAYQYKFESERAIGSLQFLMAIPVVE